jgi:hypothetical protein
MQVFNPGKETEEAHMKLRLLVNRMSETKQNSTVQISCQNMPSTKIPKP